MKRLKGLLLAAALVTALATVKAQEVSPVSFMRMNPYQTNTNVATDLPYYSYFSPYIGNFSVNFQHPRFRLRDLFNFSDLSVGDFVSFAMGLKGGNYVALNASHNWNLIGIRARNGVISYTHNLRVQAIGQFDYQLLRFIALGDQSLLGADNPTSINFALDGQVYHEYGLGYQYRINPNLSIGVRAKLLYGVLNVKTDACNYTLYPDEDGDAVHFTEDLRVRMSLPRFFVLNEEGMSYDGPFGLADFFHNSGFGIDFAANYRINEKWSVNTAVNDIGRIYWKENNMMGVGEIQDAGQYYEDNSFVFHGITEEQWDRFIHEKEYRQAVFDTLGQYFDYHMEHTGRYSTPLWSNFILRGNYDINAYNRLSLQFQGYFRPDGFRPAVTFAYGGSFFEKIDVCGTYTIQRGSYTNLGIGAGFNLGAFHIYFTSSNFLGFLNIGKNKVRDYQCGIVFNIREKKNDLSSLDDDEDEDEDEDDDEDDD